MIPVIKPQQLMDLLQTSPIILVDARAVGDARARYDAAHLDGALFVDMENQLAGHTDNAAVGGRHPLPAIADFAETLTAMGITPQSHVIVYDDKNGANAAARFWWMLKAAGHQAVQVLDGGFDAAIKAGFPVNSTPVKPLQVAAYPISGWHLPLADIVEVEQKVSDDNFMVIDVRDAYRYRGESEPIDLVAGHIPGAVNIPFSTNLDAEGFFRSPAELKQQYSDALNSRKADEVIVHCGSGVTACHTLLAMDYAGVTIPKLYVGSWGEWSRTGRAIATDK